MGDLAEGGFLEVANREAGSGQLALFEEREEVGLVFVGIGPFEELPRAVGADGALGVVSGSDGVETVVAAPLGEDAELDVPVAHHIGIRREAALVAVEEVGDDAVAILFHKIDDPERHAEVLGHSPGIDDVLLPWAIADDIILIDPVLHVGRLDVFVGLLKQQGGDGAVDAARKGDESARAGRHDF